MKYISTRSGEIATGAEAIVRGLAPCGGLYVPEFFPMLSYKDIRKLPYHQLSARVLQLYLDEFSLAELEEYTQKAYSTFTTPTVPVVEVLGGLYSMELWHGATHAFKDIALSLLPHLLTASKRKLNRTEHTIILTATSGDTGKAALEGFKDVEGTSVVVLYPSEGVSTIQKLQMTTQAGSNVKVFGVSGNFDSAQTSAKAIFSSEEIAKNLGKNRVLSSANSINIGRLLPQIAYYFHAYCHLVNTNKIDEDETIDFIVPSGNFGNILAGYYAKRMGLPINRLVCASNKNRVLTDFFQQGTYNVNRDFYKTYSPSMDILVSSNLERLLFEICNRNQSRVSSMMQSLKTQNVYTLTQEERNNLSDFYAISASEEECVEAIRHAHKYGYILDPHTAIGYHAYQKILELGRMQSNANQYLPAKTTVLVSTASPCKFAKIVVSAFGKSVDNDFTALSELESKGCKTPESLKLSNVKVRFNRVIEGDIVEFFLKEGL